MKTRQKRNNLYQRGFKCNMKGICMFQLFMISAGIILTIGELVTESKERQEICTDSYHGARCECAENYHKNENNDCIPDIYIRCNSGVINVTASPETTVRPNVTVYRGEEVIPNHPAPCTTSNVLNRMKSRCDNRQECKIIETKNVPCESFVTYDCVPKCGFNDGCNATTEICRDTTNGIRCECVRNCQENSDGYNGTMPTPDDEVNHCLKEVIIECDEGIIEIQDANNEENTPLRVHCGEKVVQNFSAPCLSQNQLDNVKRDCNNKSRCEISDEIKEQSVCVSFMKYKCVTGAAVSKDSQCSNSSIYIYCDSGVISTFLEKTKSEETFNFTAKCGEEVITNYSLPCFSKSESASIKSECDNKSKCTIFDKMSEGSPCHAFVNYKCVSRCGINHNCKETSEVCVDGEDGATCNCAEDYKMREGVCTETCRFDVHHKDGLRLTFKETFSGQVACSEEQCPPTSSFPNISQATRRCTGTWEEVQTNSCYDEDALNDQLKIMSQIEVTDDNVEEVADTLALASGQPEDITDEGLESLITSLDSIVQVGNPSPQVTDSVVGVVSNVMAVNDSTLDDTQNVNSIVTVLESQIASVLKAGQNYSDLTEYLEVNAVQIEKSALENNFTFQSNLKGDARDYDDVEDYKTSSILLPSSLVDLIDEGTTTIPISFISYQDDSLFQTEDEMPQEDARNSALYIGSHVISATLEIEDVTVEALPADSNVLIQFSKPVIPPELNDTNNTFNFLCVFWDTKSEMWSEDGCRKSSNESDDELKCSCNHLTSFAVLVSIRSDQNSPFYRVLTVISKAGCFICIISLSFCAFALLIVRPVRKKQQTHVHLNLCLALLGFYFSFLLGIDKTQNPKLCEAMTSLIYFFCFASMAWMSVEAFYIYTLIWKYKRSGIRHFIPVAASFAWGLPAIGSGLVYILDERHDYENDPDFCFLHPGEVLIYGFVLEMAILFLYNIIVFSLVSYRVTCRRIYFSNKDEKKIEIMTRVKSTFLFWILLGMSWIFGFISILQKTPNYFCDAMFCLCMSLQGFCILYMLVLQNPEMMKTLRAKRKPSVSSVTMASGMKNVYVVRRNSAEGSTLRMQSNPLNSTSEYI